ncbi:MAG: class I SAM-dependent methyltransferase [Acidobacteria bacterium]|nr:class I SAM-dependent methyltransferase [Acidobacteriota bacterium]
MATTRALRYEAKRIVRGARFRLTRRLPVHTPQEGWPGIERVAVESMPFASRFGNAKPNELAVLGAVVKFARAHTVFEFGTFDGLTTWHLARNLAPGGRVITLDLPLDHPARARREHDRTVGPVLHGVAVGGVFADTPEAERITQLLCDSQQFDPAPYRGAVDVCFVDASHTYENVKRDSESALVMTSPGGTVLWHDYSRWWPGVQRCLDELSGSLPLFLVDGTSLAALRVP